MGIKYSHILHCAEIFVKRADDDITATVGKGGEFIPAAELEHPMDKDEFSKVVLRGLGTDGGAIFNYLESKLPPVDAGKGEGAGTGRLVYDMGDGKVLKFAGNEAGKYQNQKEFNLSSESDLFTNVTESGPEYLWIVAEKVQPFSSAQDFESATGVPASLIDAVGFDYLVTTNQEAFDRTTAKVPESAKLFLTNVRDLANKFDFARKDFATIEHWGADASGKAKVFDYGLDRAGYHQFYESGVVRQRPPADEREALIQMGIPPEHHDEYGVRMYQEAFRRMKEMVKLAYKAGK